MVLHEVGMSRNLWIMSAEESLESHPSTASSGCEAAGIKALSNPQNICTSQNTNSNQTLYEPIS
jgi:hypothetical protein